jgi:hypothetical protein
MVPKPAQAFVTMYDEIFRALAVEGDFLIPKPFLVHGFDCVVTLKSPATETFSFFFQFPKQVKSRGGYAEAVRRCSGS